MIKLRSATCLFRFCRADARSNHRKHTSPLTDPVGRCHACRRAGVVVEVRFQQQIRGSWSTVALSSPAVCPPACAAAACKRNRCGHMLQRGFGFGGICVSYLHVHKQAHPHPHTTHPPTSMGLVTHVVLLTCRRRRRSRQCLRCLPQTLPQTLADCPVLTSGGASACG